MARHYALRRAGTDRASRIWHWRFGHCHRRNLGIVGLSTARGPQNRVSRDSSRPCALSKRPFAQFGGDRCDCARQHAECAGADPAFGIAIAAWLLWGAYRAARLALDQLLDREWPEEKRQRFIEVALRHPELRGIHDIRTRSSGAHDFCQFHAWVDPNMTVAAAHDIMDELEQALMDEFPGVEVLIHPDPEGHKDEMGYIPSETIQRAEQHDD